VVAADKLLPGFDPAPKVMFTIGSPKLPWQSCAETATLASNKKNTIEKNLIPLLTKNLFVKIMISAGYTVTAPGTNN
jgi:hypothetical protein